jgi:hypothetical protein
VLEVPYFTTHTVKFSKEGYEKLVDKSVGNSCAYSNRKIFKLKKLPPSKEPPDATK